MSRKTASPFQLPLPFPRQGLVIYQEGRAGKSHALRAALKQPPAKPTPKNKVAVASVGEAGRDSGSVS